MQLEDLLGTGRIGDIINALASINEIQDVRNLSETIKLNALTDTLQISAAEFDEIISNNSPVFRTIKGHAFEVAFEYLIKDTGYDVFQVGGDGFVDLIVNNNTLQLKTPYLAGTKLSIVQYKTHKTHGAKSELESIDYYHHIDHFADFLVGLISYSPLNIIILNKEELPRHPKSEKHILSPFKIDWKNHVGLNNYKRIGVDSNRLQTTALFPTDFSKELLPKSAQKLNLKTNIILDTILLGGNFRIWDMAIRGWARELAINRLFQSAGIHFIAPTVVRRDRGDKSDFALMNKAGTYDFFQVKGLSTNNCTFDGEKSIIATETQLTRGRVNDHPSQSRLYLKSDFDYLFLCVDPAFVKLYDKELGIDKGLYWKFYCIPTTELSEHAVFNNRIKSLQLFNIKDIEKYCITDTFYSKYL